MMSLVVEMKQQNISPFIFNDMTGEILTYVQRLPVLKVKMSCYSMRFLTPRSPSLGGLFYKFIKWS